MTIIMTMMIITIIIINGRPLTVSLAALLFLSPPMLNAMHVYVPASCLLASRILRLPDGSTVTRWASGLSGLLSLDQRTRGAGSPRGGEQSRVMSSPETVSVLRGCLANSEPNTAISEQKAQQQYKRSCHRRSHHHHRHGRTGRPGNLALARWAGWFAGRVGRHVKS